MRRRSALLALGSLGFLSEVNAAVRGNFQARLLSTGRPITDEEKSAAARWGWELVERTSAPAELTGIEIAVESSDIILEPFVVWSGTEDPGELSALAVRRLREFFRLGGLLLVDDRAPDVGVFGAAARRELLRVVPDAPPIALAAGHVLFKSFYLIDRPYGRVEGPSQVEAIVQADGVRAILLSHDLLGALARRGETWALPVEPGGTLQRELAVRLAINIAMFVLCTDYKDDQVHAPFLMRRRARGQSTRGGHGEFE